MTDCDASVKAVEQVGPGIFRIVLLAPGTARESLPGQFLMIEASPGPFPLLRRPFTVSSADRAGGTLELLFRVTGGGTGALSRLSRGDSVRVLGPLGRGWPVSDGRWLLVGGGMGAAGFPFLASRLGPHDILLGAGNAASLAWTPPGALLATEDGSAGTKGLVTCLLDRIDPFSYERIAVCGPVAMMRAVVAALPPGVRASTLVSLESRMACGWGVCGGCAVPASGGGFLRCCADGPVFEASELDWDRIEEAAP
ncbi:dihydroorotate dehydrogenase electron transfer subunit [Candidatus Fermentibacteria bacterium]|nr:dihydroorotate dehydrogenase electron transfer subunit [Candidatus Fermentibacteria bacterium]